MNMLRDISRKIDPEIAAAIVAFKKVADEEKIPFIIVGATARDILLEYCHGIAAPRMTVDVDIGSMVSSWEEYTVLSDALIATGRFAKGKEPHRYNYGKRHVDVIPFGAIAGVDGTISWRMERMVLMSTLGFEDALRSAITVRIDDRHDIQVPTIPSLAILKLIAWDEAYPDRKKDADDLLFLMMNYEHTIPEDHLYKDEQDLLINERFDTKLASIRLLGRDMARTVDPNTNRKIIEILLRETSGPDASRLTSQLVTIYSKFHDISILLGKLAEGYLEQARS